MKKFKLNKAFWRDVRFLKWAGQILFLFFIINLIQNFFGQAIANLNATNLPFSWRFLGSTPGIQVSEGFVTYPESGLQALQIGMANMLRITVSGIFFATFLGTLMGIARLSKNWIVERATTGFVETVRNIPLLVQIFFWQAVILSFPRLEEGSNLFYILGDNFFEKNPLKDMNYLTSNPTAFLMEVDNPEEFGVVELKNESIVSVEEKPKNPKSNLIAVGLYYFDSNCFEYIKLIKQSSRGEYEITSLLEQYINNNQLSYLMVNGWWIDAGTPEAVKLYESLV